MGLGNSETTFVEASVLKILEMPVWGCADDDAQRNGVRRWNNAIDQRRVCACYREPVLPKLSCCLAGCSLAGAFEVTVQTGSADAEDL